METTSNEVSAGMLTAKSELHTAADGLSCKLHTAAPGARIGLYMTDPWGRHMFGGGQPQNQGTVVDNNALLEDRRLYLCSVADVGLARLEL